MSPFAGNTAERNKGFSHSRALCALNPLNTLKEQNVADDSSQFIVLNKISFECGEHV